MNSGADNYLRPPMRFLYAHLALLAVAVIYGANYIIAKEVLDNEFLQPKGFILLRVGFGALMFVIVHYFFIRESVERQDLLRLALCGLFGVAVNQTFFFMGLELTTPINASLIMITTPIIVLLLATIFLHEKLGLFKIIGLVLGISGAAWLILSRQSSSYGTNIALGNLFIWINATSYGIYLIIVKSLLKKYHVFTVIKWAFVFGFLYMIPLGAKEIASAPFTTFTNGIWLAIGYVLLFTTFIAYLLNAYSLSLVSPIVVSAYIFLQPVVATLSSLMFDKDVLDGTKLFCGLLILIGVGLVSINTKSNTAKFPTFEP